MRLLGVAGLRPKGDGKLRLKEYFDDDVPPYAILSHTWSRDPQDEVLFNDIVNGTALEKKAFYKLRFTANQALRDELEYVWIDTCCIDKNSSAELQEAINSMYRWYQDSAVCYVYLEDVTSPHKYSAQEIALRDQIRASRWFTRGWTLQELLAPEVRKFFSSDWHYLGKIGQNEAEVDLSRTYNTVLLNPMIDIVGQVTSIPSKFLTDRSLVTHASIGLRMSWAAERRTTRREDMAYSLLGIFGVNMPLLYGEGDKAFLRLQEEIMRRSADATLFVWNRLKFSEHKFPGSSLLAGEPFAFQDIEAANLEPQGWVEAPPFTMTSFGLQIRIPLVRLDDRADMHIGVLDCTRGIGAYYGQGNPFDRVRYAVYLKKLRTDTNLFARVFHHRLLHIPEPFWPMLPSQASNIFLPLDPARWVDHTWAGSTEDFVEDIKQVQIRLTSPGAGIRHCTFWNKSVTGWKQTHAEPEKLFTAHSTAFVISRLPLAICIHSPGYESRQRPFQHKSDRKDVLEPQRPIYIVLSRSDYFISAAALQLNTGPEQQRRKYRITVEDLYSEPTSDLESPKTSSGSQVELGYRLSIDVVDRLIDDYEERKQEYIKSKKLNPWYTGLGHWIALEKAYSEKELERAARERSQRTYVDGHELLDSLAECNSISLLRRQSTLPSSWDNGLRLCRCCISLQPASGISKDGSHIAKYAEVVA